ncbi:MAG: class I SAM-dependent methyltransferase [Bacillota bacterium]|nr:class I SAM-dependent methyltransferase [Bacillota bacterium]
MIWYIVGGVGILSLISICFPSLYGGAWSPSRMRLVRKMLKMAELKPGETLIDLGAGDGRVILTAAREFGAKAIGVEIDPVRLQICKTRASALGLDSLVTVSWGNFFEMDMSAADVVSFYLSQAAADKLADKLRKELKPGARVVSNRRPMPGWDAEKVDRLDRLYVYRVT